MQWVSKFHENVYSSNAIELTEENVMALSKNLGCNQATGFLAGHYDEKLSITKVSDYFLALLGFSYEEFMERVDGSLLRAFHGENQSFLLPERFPILHGSGEGTMVNSENVPLHVHMYKSDTVNSRGERVWLLSVRVDGTYENLHLVSGAMEGGLWYMNFDADGKLSLVSVNHDLRLMLGYHDIIDMPNESAFLFHIIHPEDREYVEGRIRLLIAGKAGDSRYHVEFRIRHADGRYIWVRAKGELTRRLDGTPYRMAGVLFNIDGEREMREKVQRFDAFHHAFTEANYCEYYVDLVGNRFDSLKGSHSLLAREECCATWDELVEACLSKWVYPEDQEQVAAFMSRSYMQEKFLEGQRELSLDCRIRASDGLRWIRIAVFCDGEMDSMRHAIAYIRDVTKVKVEEEELSELHRKNDAMSLLLNGAAKILKTLCLSDLENGIYHIFRPEGEGIAEEGLNDELTAYLDRTYKVMGEESRFSEILAKENLRKQLKAESDVYRFEYATWDEKNFFSASITPLSWTAGGKVKEVLGMVEDVTRERKEEILSRKALAEACHTAEEASHAKSDFLSNMSHDIHTPMNVIIGMTALAERHIREPGELKKCLHKISDASRGLLEIMDEILDMTHIEGGNLSLDSGEFRIRALLDDVAEAMKHEIAARHHSFQVRVQDLKDDAVQGDAAKIRQLLLHILANAVRYTPDGGHISLTVRELPHPVPGMGAYECIVEDDGVGMSEEFQKKALEPFVRGDDKRVSGVQGTGLGLAIAKNIISLMGGHLQLDSTPGKGTRVTITCSLPLATEKKKEERPAIEAPNLAGRHILVAEDNELNLEIAVEILAMTGADIETAIDGREAVEAVKASAPGWYDLVLMDIQMPKLDGYEATRAIRALPGMETLPIVAMTANTFVEDAAKARAAGMNEHLPKPLDLSRLYGVLRKYIQ